MSELDTARGKAFDFAQETTKQLLTLATAIFALTLTFAKAIVDDDRGAEAVVEWLYVAWALYLVSVAAGVVTLMMLAGNLERAHRGGAPSIYAGNTRWAAATQVVAFFLALGFTFAFGAKVT